MIKCYRHAKLPDKIRLMIALLLIPLLLLSFPLLFMQNNSDKRLDDIEEAIDYIDETSDIINVESIQNMNAEHQIELLLTLERNNIEEAKAQIIDVLSSHFTMSNEAIQDGMANDAEKDIVSKIEMLSKDYDSFKDITKR